MAPIITLAIRPIALSGPYVLSRSVKTTIAPLPDTGRISANGITSRGSPKSRPSGDNANDNRSSPPLALNIPTATTSATSAGRIRQDISRPSFAPSRNTSNTRTPLIRPYPIISTTAVGIAHTPNAVIVFSSSAAQAAWRLQCLPQATRPKPARSPAEYPAARTRPPVRAAWLSWQGSTELTLY